MKNTINNQQYHYQSGATLAEALYILPIFFIILFGMMEMTFIYKGKNTLNLATSEAARKGSFNHAELGSIQTALSEGMAPLYAGRSSCLGNAIEEPGVRCARLIQGSINAVGAPKLRAVTILSPTKEIFDVFAVEHNIKLPGVPGGQHRQKYMPNDNLNWRTKATVPVTIGGKSEQINIQDANLLKIKTFWCQKLSVPGLDLLFYNAILRFNTSPEQFYCNQLTKNISASSPSTTVFGRTRGYYIAIRSHAITRMHSPVMSDTPLLTSDEVEDAIDPDPPTTNPEPPIVINDPPPSCDPATQECSPPTCNPDTENCGSDGDYCDANTGICYDCSGLLCVSKCNPVTGIGCPCDKGPNQPNSSPVPNFTPIFNTAK